MSAPVDRAKRAKILQAETVFSQLSLAACADSGKGDATTIGNTALRAPEQPTSCQKTESCSQAVAEENCPFLCKILLYSYLHIPRCG